MGQTHIYRPVAASVEEVCKTSDWLEQRRRRSSGTGFSKSMTYDIAGLQWNHAFKNFPVKYKAKVHTKFVACFYSWKFYSYIVLLTLFYILFIYLLSRYLSMLNCYIHT
jgi:hypothetical protein